VLTELKRLYRNRQVKDEYLFRIISRSGRIHWIESRVAVLNWRRMRLLISAVDVSEREAAQSKLQAYATYDELTGIYNRRVGLALLEKEMHRAERERIPLSVCYMDVNGLKWVNDHFGHSAGDQLLLEVVQGIIDAMRKGDVVCRLGGDEFLGIFPQCNTDNAEKIWQRIEERYVAMNGIPGRVYYISVSHGITEYSGEEGCTVEELLRDTDLRMYEEKRRLREGKKEV
jgi:diguanylate cyclase (GGDEF)-like protein